MNNTNAKHAISNTYADLERKWKESQRKQEYELELARGFSIADMYLTQRYLDRLNLAPTDPPSESITTVGKLRIFEITKVVYNPSELINDKIISIYGALHDLGASVALIICGMPTNTRLYIAVRVEDAVVVAGNVLSSSLVGNFPGIDIKPLEKEEKLELMQCLLSDKAQPKSLASVSFIPSERDDDKKEFVQGLEKFIDSMNGKTYSAIFLADPISADELSVRRHGFEELYSTMSPHSKTSVSYAVGKTTTVTEGISNSISSSISRGVTNTTGTNTANSSGSNASSSSNFGFSGEGWNGGFGCSDGSFSSYTTGSSFANSVSDSLAKTEQDGSHKDKSVSQNATDTSTLNYENKGVSMLLEKVDAQLVRMKDGESFGLWKFGCYFFSDDISTTVLAANIFKALMTGRETHVENTHVNIWQQSQQKNICDIVGHARYLVHPTFTVPAFDVYEAQTVTPTSMISGKELPMIFGFPRKSIAGLPVVEMAEFGRTVVYRNPEYLKRSVNFGNIYHMGSAINLRVPLNIDLLSSHCFITGSSGSGKSYATYQLLDALIQQKVKILVIEPAKGEYKQVFGGLKGLRIFTVDPNVYRFLKINPFQFPENLSVLSHIEKLIQIFNASWSLYSAMPAILKDAVVRAYIARGWDIQNSVWIEGVSIQKYPVFEDVMNILPKIIDASDYSAEIKGNYKGALLMRLQAMTTGIAGAIFAQHEGVPDTMLFDANTVIDLSDIGSEETVALLMGVLIMKLGEYRASVRKASSNGRGRDEPLQHVTVLEEAHNILKRTSKEQSEEGSNIVGKSVEMIANSIKEMRTYGEGFIIIDQSPMAVDIAAIENTATKIIMNTPAKEACEELSSALSLNEEQSRELSRLDVGVAAVFQKGWLEPVLVKIDKWENAYEIDVQRATHSAIKILRGKLLEELFCQFENNDFLPMRFKQIIRGAELADDKKREYEDIVSSLNQKFSSGINSFLYNDFADSVLAILSCQGLFQVFNAEHIENLNTLLRILQSDPKNAEKIKSKYDKKCGEFVSSIGKALNYYVSISDNGLLRKIIKALLWNLSGQAAKETPFTAVYFLLDDNVI